MNFAWKDNSRIKLDPIKVGQELTRLQTQSGGFTPQAVVDAASDPSSPLHDGFEWDDAAAAAQHRLDQARYLIRMLVIVEDRQHQPIRAFVSVTPAERGTIYQDIGTVFRDEYLRKQALDQARKELESFRRKYSDLTELADVLQAADRALAVGE